MAGDVNARDVDSNPRGRPRAVLQKSSVKRGAVPRSNHLFEAVIRIEAFFKVSDSSDRGNTQGANGHRVQVVPSLGAGIIGAIVIGFTGKADKSLHMVVAVGCGRHLLKGNDPSDVERGEGNRTPTAPRAVLKDPHIQCVA